MRLSSVTSLFLFSLSPFVHAATVSSTRSQVFTGIGGSGAWWPNDIYHFPEATRQNLSNLLFSQDGLGLSSYRYNIGAGGVNVSNPARAPETFYVKAGQYNWNADAQGVYFLREAARHGVQSITAFSNSAPAALTSGKASCNSAFVTGTGAAYGAYLADVVQHFRNEGVNISYISAINEPDSNFGPSPCNQEGMQVVPSQRAEVVNGLYSALSSRGMTSTVGILADESSNLANAGNEYAAWLPQVLDKVAALVHHTYDFPSDASYTSYTTNTNKAYPGKAIWMSEVCCSLGNPDGSGKGWAGGYDPTIKNALLFSSLMFQSFVTVSEPHYDFWTLVSSQLGCSPLNNPSCVNTANSNGWNDGLIYYDPTYATNKNYQLYIKKQFWTFKHFSNFVKPGSERRAITGSDVNTKLTMAVASQNGFNVLAQNPGTSDITINLTFPEGVCATTGFRTSASEDFARISGAVKSGQQWSMTLKGQSLSTFSFDRRAC